MDDNTKDYLGVGLGFPMEIDSGSVVLQRGVDLVTASIKHILSYEVPRYFRADFYNNIWRVADQAGNSASRNLVRVYIVEAIERFETRVILKSVEVVFDEQTRNMKALVVYQVKDSGLSDSIILNLQSNE